MADDALFQFLLRMGDNTLVLGHRFYECCGKAPVLEEDIALANTALDLIGQTQMWLGYAAEVQGEGKSADDLAYLRDVWDFRNLLMLERPNLDFGHTMMRQYLFDAYHHLLLGKLAGSSDTRVAKIAAKCVKEAAYHLDRSGETVVSLGDGTAESNRRMQDALDLLWPFAGEMFLADDVDDAMAAAGIAPELAALKAEWETSVRATLRDASLTIPEDDFAHKGGKTGRQHTEHLGHMLAQMQFLQRAYPGASW